MADPQNDLDDGEDVPAQYASPPCFMHELMPGYDGGQSVSVDVARWRKAERARLIEARLALSADTRGAHAAIIAEKLDAALGDAAGVLVALYWPFRGEPDLREWAGRVIERGGAIALPVVLAKATPLEFRRWAPGDRLEKGVWNIPIPAEGEAVFPDVVVSPVVGFDSGNYRLGYGGGFYDRTLASLPRKPRVFGVGYAMQEIATIYPQAYDIPMDVVFTERP